MPLSYSYKPETNSYIIDGGCGDTNIIIPDTFNGPQGELNVTEIGANAFLLCTNLLSVNIPSTITIINDLAFAGCSSLSNVVFQEGITTIGSNVFDQCTSLININLPNSLINLGDYVFKDCANLTNVILGNNIISIGQLAFFNCYNLSNINIPPSVTSIGGSAFQNCSSLNNINIPNTITTIGGSAFTNCSSLTEINIPNSVIDIGYGAFQGCTSLTDVVFGNSLQTLGDFLFGGCTNLNNVYFLGNAPSMQPDTFSNIPQLFNILTYTTKSGWGPFTQGFFVNKLIVSEAGDSMVDGIYTRTSGGTTTFFNPENSNSIFWDGSNWYIYNDTVGINRYVNTAGDSNAASLTENWATINPFFNPPPIVTIGGPIQSINRNFEGLQSFGFPNVSTGKISIKKQNSLGSGGKLNLNSSNIPLNTLNIRVTNGPTNAPWGVGGSGGCGNDFQLVTNPNGNYWSQAHLTCDFFIAWDKDQYGNLPYKWRMYYDSDGRIDYAFHPTATQEALPSKGWSNGMTISIV